MACIKGMLIKIAATEHSDFRAADLQQKIEVMSGKVLDFIDKQFIVVTGALNSCESGKPKAFSTPGRPYAVALSFICCGQATELNDKAVRAAERRVAEVTRAAGEQTAQAERELADAAQTVDDLEEKLDELQDGYDRLTLALESERSQRQQQDVEMAQLKERLAAAEENARQREERYQEQKTVLQDALNAEQAQHKNTREDLQKRLEQISAEANARTEELKSERDKVNILLTRLESQENALASERQQHQATRETLQQRLDQAVTDAQARAGELALERDRVSSLSARLESQEKASSEQLVRMGSEIASLTDRCTQLENQRDDARLETMGEKETVAALRGEAEALKRQNQSLMAALSGNKQTGDQNA